MSLPVIEYDEWQNELDKIAIRGIVCAECGGTNIRSCGIAYRCYDCDKRWRKIYRPKALLGEGKTCSRCKSSHIVSRGDSWSCNDCHRRWMKC